MHVQELTTKVADLKAQASDRATPHKVSFASPDQQPPQYQQQPPQYQQQAPQYQAHQPQQQPYGAQPTLMWDQSMTPVDNRQSGAWKATQRPQTAQAGPGEVVVQLPQLLQKLQKTQQKLEARDASARKYKVRCLVTDLPDWRLWSSADQANFARAITSITLGKTMLTAQLLPCVLHPVLTSFLEPNLRSTPSTSL